MNVLLARVAGVTIAGTILILSSAGAAGAQSKCDAGKLKEYGKKVFCLAKVDSKASKKGQAVDAAKEAKCVSKFLEKCAKAEAQGDCTATVKDCSALAGEADTCREATELVVTPCELVAQTGCDVAEACYLIAGEATCLNEGTVPVGGTCSGTPEDCVGGTQCFDTGGSVFQCLELCEISPSSCSLGTCTSLSEPSYPNLGVCQ